jgi:hypothetical protein
VRSSETLADSLRKSSGQDGLFWTRAHFGDDAATAKAC